MVHRLRVFRQQQKISAAALATTVGATKASICRIEQGKQTPSLDLMFRLVDAANGFLTADDFNLLSAPATAPAPAPAQASEAAE
jgi:DNA-binding XRE family transcriptional regulator